MAKRKETRHCQYAIRTKAAECRTEFTLEGYDGEGQDFQDLIFMHEDSNTLSSDQILKIFHDAGYLCKSADITVIDEIPVSNGTEKVR